MIRIHIICEGQTEETFIRELLARQFETRGLYLVPTLIGTQFHKGGNVKADRLLHALRAMLLRDVSSFCTTFFDYYGLAEDFPGKKDAKKATKTADKATCVQKALMSYFEKQIGDEAVRRFIPYVQMHEFEGLLFSDPANLAQGIYKEDLAPEFGAIRIQFSTPEDINDSYETAPSKRIARLYPGYKKTLSGLQAAERIGIDKIRAECQLFDKWITSLETLNK
jgi:hypothetical protein